MRAALPQKLRNHAQRAPLVLEVHHSVVYLQHQRGTLGVPRGGGRARARARSQAGLLGAEHALMTSQVEALAFGHPGACGSTN